MSLSRGLDNPYPSGELWISLVEMNHHHETFSGFEYCQTLDPQKYHQMNHFQINLIVAYTNEYPISKLIVPLKISILATIALGSSKQISSKLFPMKQ